MLETPPVVHLHLHHLLDVADQLGLINQEEAGVELAPVGLQDLVAALGDTRTARQEVAA